MSEYEGDERRAGLHAVADLREATLRLSEEVSTLSHALQAVGLIQAKQIEMTKQIEDTQGEVHAVTQTSLVNTVARRRFYRSVPLLVLILLLGGVIYTENNRRISIICHHRNDQAAATQKLLELYILRTPPGVNREQLQRTDRAFSPVNCNVLY